MILRFFAATVSTGQGDVKAGTACQPVRMLVKAGGGWYVCRILFSAEEKCRETSMFVSRLKKFFGIGPIGMMISFSLLTAAFFADRRLGGTAILEHPLPLQIAAGSLTGAGLCLLAWGARTLRSWWINGELCTDGPFRWFRHPIYAAYLTFLFPAAALFFNSWIMLAAAAALHPLWHLLVRHEEAMMLEKFAERYRDYMRRTGRFFPKFQQCF